MCDPHFRLAWMQHYAVRFVECFKTAASSIAATGRIDAWRDLTP
jgi:hypothetical protein